MTSSDLFLFQLGDEILEGNGRGFHRLTHDEAVRILKCSQAFDLVVRHVGKVPHATSMPGNESCDLVGKPFGPSVSEESCEAFYGLSFFVGNI